jgi:hypothetical protein
MDEDELARPIVAAVVGTHVAPAIVFEHDEAGAGHIPTKLLVGMNCHAIDGEWFFLDHEASLGNERRDNLKK